MKRVEKMASSADFTTIITTSPSPVHPSTELIVQVLASLKRHAPLLAASRTIVVCDGCKLAERCKYRMGVVDADAHARYLEYKSRLRALARADGFEIVELDVRHGFGNALRAGLIAFSEPERRVTTPLIAVVQHDRNLMRDVDVAAVGGAILASGGDVGYALLPTASTRKYAEQTKARLGARGLKGEAADITRHARPIAGGARLLPCVQYFDSTHIASAEWYRRTIFAEPGGYAGFIESFVGPLQTDDVLRLGVEEAIVRRWRTYVLDDGDDAPPAVGHLNGSRSRGLAELDAKYSEHRARGKSVGRRSAFYSGPVGRRPGVRHAGWLHEEGGAAVGTADDSGLVVRRASRRFCVALGHALEVYEERELCVLARGGGALGARLDAWNRVVGVEPASAAAAAALEVGDLVVGVGGAALDGRPVEEAAVGGAAVGEGRPLEEAVGPHLRQEAPCQLQVLRRSGEIALAGATVARLDGERHAGAAFEVSPKDGSGAVVLIAEDAAGCERWVEALRPVRLTS